MLALAGPPQRSWALAPVRPRYRPRGNPACSSSSRAARERCTSRSIIGEPAQQHWFGSIPGDSYELVDENPLVESCVDTRRRGRRRIRSRIVRSVACRPLPARTAYEARTFPGSTESKPIARDGRRAHCVVTLDNYYVSGGQGERTPALRSELPEVDPRLMRFRIAAKTQSTRARLHARPSPIH
jgi:hypothetical protein